MNVKSICRWSAKQRKETVTDIRKGEYEEVVEETVTELFAIHGAFFKVFDDLPMKVHLIVLTV